MLIYRYFYASGVNNTFQVIGVYKSYIAIRNFWNLKYYISNYNDNYSIYQFINVQGNIAETSYKKILSTNISPATNWDFRYYIFNFYSKFDGYQQTLIPMTFGYTYKTSSLIDNASKIGIMHLLIISGLHFGIIDKILKKITKRKWIGIFVIGIYWFLCNWSFSTNRAFVFKILPRNKKYFKDKSDKYLFTAFICIALNNQINLSVGLFITFILTYLLLFTKKLTRIKTKIITSLALWFISILFIIYMNKNINLLSFLIIPIFAILYEIILIVSLVLFWFPFASFLVIYSVNSIISMMLYFVVNIKIEFLYVKEIMVVLIYVCSILMMYLYKKWHYQL
ncbi:ComEC/Rec2 family competence protein [Mycoplasma sp. 394]